MAESLPSESARSVVSEGVQGSECTRVLRKRVCTGNLLTRPTSNLVAGVHANNFRLSAYVSRDRYLRSARCPLISPTVASRSAPARELERVEAVSLREGDLLYSRAPVAREEAAVQADPQVRRHRPGMGGRGARQHLACSTLAGGVRRLPVMC